MHNKKSLKIGLRVLLQVRPLLVNAFPQILSNQRDQQPKGPFINDVTHSSLQGGGETIAL